MLKTRQRSGRKYRRGAGYRLMREICVQRDHYACVGCGKRVPLSCHHVFAERFLRRLKIKTILVHDPANGASLCRACHARITHEAEPMLFAGNLLGFLQALNRISFELYGRARRAAELYGIDVSRIQL